MMTSMIAVELPVPPPCRATQPAAGEEDSDRDSDPAFVSPLDEVKAVQQQPPLTTANLHEASRSLQDSDSRDSDALERLVLWRGERKSKCGTVPLDRQAGRQAERQADRNNLIL